MVVNGNWLWRRKMWKMRKGRKAYSEGRKEEGKMSVYI